MRALPGGYKGRESEAAAETDPELEKEEEDDNEEPETEPPEKMAFEDALAAGDSNGSDQGTS